MIRVKPTITADASAIFQGFSWANSKPAPSRASVEKQAQQDKGKRAKLQDVVTEYVNSGDWCDDSAVIVGAIDPDQFSLTLEA
ncbi:hypothetical protein [Chromobacterium phragmitis]|uniref:Uncharacterized protein n=1 Tax=Chromobacterium phragmitis TaxID=2202141 RepID=A0ABV0J0M4_9NEIS